MQVDVRNLTRRFGSTLALDNVSFQIPDGRIFGFVGANGAGKTTAIEIMAGLDEPQQGDVWFDDTSMLQNPEKLRRKIGYMPDSLPDNSDLTVEEYLLFYGRAFGLNKSERRNALTRLADYTTNLDTMLDKRLSQLSKGMKQQVSLARSLMHDPELLLLDEPAAGLDPRARIELRRTLKKLGEAGKTIFISSHILSELDDICDGVVIIAHGKILSCGLLSELGSKKITSATALHTAELTFESPQKAQMAMEQLKLYKPLTLVKSRANFLSFKTGDAAAEAKFMSALFQVPDNGLSSFKKGDFSNHLEELFLERTQAEAKR